MWGCPRSPAGDARALDTTLLHRRSPDCSMASERLPFSVVLPLAFSPGNRSLIIPVRQPRRSAKARYVPLHSTLFIEGTHERHLRSDPHHGARHCRRGDRRSSLLKLQRLRLEEAKLRAGDPGDMNDLVRQVSALQHELTEVQERLDFAERMLAQARETPGLPAAPPPH